MTTRRSFTPEYKLEAVAAAERSGNAVQTARDLGIRPALGPVPVQSTAGSASSATTAAAPSPVTARRETRNSPGSSAS